MACQLYPAGILSRVRSIFPKHEGTQIEGKAEERSDGRMEQKIEAFALVNLQTIADTPWATYLRIDNIRDVKQRR